MVSSKSKAEKWKTAFEASVDSAIERTKNIKESPVIKSIENKDKLVSNWNYAIESGKWAKKLIRGNYHQFWKENTVKGWEKNRKISNDVVEYMTRYYSSLKTLTDKISLVSDSIISAGMPLANSKNYPSFIVKQHVSQAIAKFQKVLYFVNDIDTIFNTIKDFMIDKFGYTENIVILDVVNPISDIINSGFESEPFWDKIVKDPLNNDSNHISNIVGFGYSLLRLELDSLDDSFYELGDNTFYVNARYKNGHFFSSMRYSIFVNGFSRASGQLTGNSNEFGEIHDIIGFQINKEDKDQVELVIEVDEGSTNFQGKISQFYLSTNNGEI